MDDDLIETEREARVIIMHNELKMKWRVSEMEIAIRLSLCLLRRLKNIVAFSVRLGKDRKAKLI